MIDLSKQTHNGGGPTALHRVLAASSVPHAFLRLEGRCGLLRHSPRRGGSYY